MTPPPTNNNTAIKNPYNAWVSGIIENVRLLPNIPFFSEILFMPEAAAMPWPIAETAARPTAILAPRAITPTAVSMPALAAPSIPPPTKIRIEIRKAYNAWVSGSTENSMLLPNILGLEATAPTPAEAVIPWPTAETPAKPTPRPAAIAKKPRANPNDVFGMPKTPKPININIDIIKPYNAWVSGRTENIMPLPNTFAFSSTALILPAAAIPWPIAETPARPTARPAPIVAKPITIETSFTALPNKPTPTMINIAIRNPYNAWVSGSTENNMLLPSIFLFSELAPRPAEDAIPWPIAEIAAMPTAKPAPTAPKP